MNIKFYISFVLIALGVNMKGHAQVSFNKRAIGSIGAAPKVGDFLNSASLENVDMATGTLKVGIPLYEIKVNDISVPISLNYTAQGLKVGQEAGAPGMGWELSAGGKIITNVQGRKDSDLGTSIYSGNYHTALIANPGSFDPYVTHQSVASSIVNGDGDGAWDTYSYILPNGGGTYIRNGLTFPYDPQITIQHPGIIKTTDGLIYNFTVGDKKQSKKRTYYEPNAATTTYIGDVNFARDPSKTSTWDDWDLTKIISTRFKDTVSFEYASITDTSILAKKARVSTSETLPLYRNVLQEQVAFAYSELGAKVGNGPDNRYYDIQYPIIAQSKMEYTAHTRLSKIKFPNGEARFSYAVNDILGRDVLTEIYIYQRIGNDSTLLKKFKFHYDENQILNYGHYLQSIDVYDSKDIKTGAWSFTYNDKLPVNPTIANKAQDKWGFFNNETANKTLLESPDNMLPLRQRKYLPIKNSETDGNKSIEYSRPEATDFYGFHNGTPTGGYNTYSIPFANREFAFGWAVKGTLKSVKTPTGASVEYEYEPHRFKKSVFIAGVSTSQQFTGGGIRIKSITKDMKHDSLYTYSADMKIIKKNYTYGEGTYTASGSADENNGFGNVTMPGTVVTNTSRYYKTDLPGQFKDVVNMNLLSHPINSMSQYNGSYAIYKSVSETIMTGVNEDTFGKTVYYNNVPDFNDRPDFFWQPDNGIVSTMDIINLPLMDVNAGVRKELIVGTDGIKKYAFKGTAGYKAVEETRYTYKSFQAPLNLYPTLLSLYITTAAQVSGPWPYSAVQAKDDGMPMTRGGVAFKLFNSTHSSNGFGLMDYISMTNLFQEPNVPLFPGKYAWKIIDMATLSNSIRKVGEQTTTFDDNLDPLTRTMTETKYDYGNLAHLLPTRIATKNSKGDSIIVRNRYVQDMNTNLSPFSTMVSSRVGLSEPLEEVTIYKEGATEYVKEARVNTFQLIGDGPFPVPLRVYNMNVAGKVTASTSPYFVPGSSSGFSDLFKEKVNYNTYSKGNVTRYTDETSSATSIIWGYKNQYPIAKILNVDEGAYAAVDSVAFANFESEDKGNWVYSGQPVADSTSPFGKKIYSLASGSVSKPSYASAGRFIISYWYKTGATVNITGVNLGPVQVKNTKADWTLVEREILGFTSNLVVSGTGFIDELRLYPQGALMTTYNYEPLVGLTSTIDPKGKIQYYDYDDSQRLKNIRDQDGNIIKSYKYIMGTSN